MKFTLSWLKQHLDTEAGPQQIGDTLTALGLELERIEDKAAALAPFVVAAVKSAEPHPNADRLRVCIVDTGAGEIQVVCGAPNARAGMRGVFAPAGTHIPGTGIDLKASIIRGVASNGMLLSERELGLSDEHQGIIDLPPDTPVGTPFAEVLGAADPVIEIALTPDRADCAGVRGIARDLAAAGLGRLKPLSAEPVAGGFESPVHVRFAFPPDAGTPCPIFAGRLIRGVRNGPSPRWLQDRLSAIGLRPISALVDITNFFTMDQARPLHVFDADRLQGDLVLRWSVPGERLAALNGKTYTMPDDRIIVIADDSGPVSLAGLVGGETTGCTEGTTAVFLECALFDPLRIAAGGRKLGVESDARYRNERGVDPESVLPGIEQATRMILDLCGGEPGEVVVTGAVPDWRRQIGLRPGRVAALGGVDVPAAEQARILDALGCRVAPAPDGTLSVEPPSWRADIEGEADLVEEVLRVHGFDRVPAVPLPRLTALTRPAVTPRQRQADMVRRVLAGRGLDEAVTWSFMASGKAAWFGFQNTALRLVNPIASDLDVMRPSILANLADAARRNFDRQAVDSALFEVGPIYRDATPEGQTLVAAGLRTGRLGPPHWAAPARPVDAFDAKADALAALDAFGAPVANLQASADAPDWYHPGRSGCLRLGAAVLAHFGELHPAVLEALGLPGPVAAFEAFLDAVPAPKVRRGMTARPPLVLSSLQPVERDLAFLVGEAVPSDRLVRAVRSADKALITEIAIFDVYRGTGVPDGMVSIALRIRLQPRETTLTEAEIDAVVRKAVEAAAWQTGATLRG